jgi:hypothetical protein
MNKTKTMISTVKSILAVMMISICQILSIVFVLTLTPHYHFKNYACIEFSVITALMTRNVGYWNAYFVTIQLLFHLFQLIAGKR